jgi:hypothetical protein
MNLLALLYRLKIRCRDIEYLSIELKRDTRLQVGYIALALVDI